MNKGHEERRSMNLIAVMYAYNLNAKAAAHMLEVLSQDKINAAIELYWRHAERKQHECS